MNGNHAWANREKECPTRCTSVRTQRGEENESDRDWKIIVALAKISHNYWYLEVKDLLSVWINVSLTHAFKCLFSSTKWMVFVFFFSPYRLPDYYKRAFYIGEYGTPIETQLYHHFKLNRHKIHLLFGNSQTVVRK